MRGKSRGTGPSKRIRKSTEDAILAVTANDQADGAHVPSGPLRSPASAARGWPRG